MVADRYDALLSTASIQVTVGPGFGASNPFGGPIATPNLDRLAQSGLRSNQFHTTALGSPTRAALITGRNHHSTSWYGKNHNVPDWHTSQAGPFNLGG